MNIFVYYGYDQNKDDTVRKLARKYKGREQSAGTNLQTGMRDMSFSFGRRDADAKRFARVVRKQVKVRKVGYYIEKESKKTPWGFEMRWKPL